MKNGTKGGLKKKKKNLQKRKMAPKVGWKTKEISRKGKWHQKWAERKKSPEKENGTKSGLKKRNLQKRKMAPKVGVPESGILSPASHFQLPQPIPTDTSILRAPFLSTAEFSIRRPKERGNFSTLNEFWFLGPARGMATISPLILRHLHSYCIHVYWSYHFLFSIDC